MPSPADARHTDLGGKAASILAGLTEALSADGSVTFEPGCLSAACPERDFSAAVSAARRSRVAVVVVGTIHSSKNNDDSFAPCGALDVNGVSPTLPIACGMEGHDRSSIALAGNQLALAHALRRQATGTPLVCVLVHGGSLALGNLLQDCDALVDAWLPGGQGARGLADTLFGVVSPAGRSPQTFYRDNASLPAPGDMRLYANASRGSAGWTYRYTEAAIDVPFGAGLSFTTFTYSNLRTNTSAMAGCDVVSVSVSVTNAGSMDSDEVVQLYVEKPPGESGGSPKLRLADFARVHVRAGQTAAVALQLTPKNMFVVADEDKDSFWEPTMMVEPGPVVVHVGGGQPGFTAGTLSRQMTVSTAGRLNTRYECTTTGVPSKTDDESGFQTVTIPPVALFADGEFATSGGVDVDSVPFISVDGPPAFQWQIGECTRCHGIRQLGFQLMISRGQQPVYDSGNVQGGESMHICRSLALASDTRYEYTVRVEAVDSVGERHYGSHRGRFGVALAAVDWATSQWIGGGTQFRHDFALPAGDVTAATAYVAGVGCATLSVNSGPASDARLEPGWAHLPTVRMPFRAYDVGHLLRPGSNNTLGLRVGMCHYGYVEAFCAGAHAANANCRALRLVLTVHLANGATQTVASQAGVGWQQTSVGDPIRYSHLYHGEIRDQRREEPGWDSPGERADEPAWAPSVKYARADAEFGAMSLATYPPVAIAQSRTAVSFRRVDITPNPENRSVYIFNFFQNIAGMATLRLSPGDAKAGDQFVLKYAELTVERGMKGYSNGSGAAAMAFCHWNNINDTAPPIVGTTPCPGAGPFQGNSANQTDVYIARGDPDGESFTPTFTYHGYRLVQLEGPAHFVPTADTLTAHFIHSNVSQTGHVHFHLEHSSFNRMQSAMHFTQLSNLVHIPTDCPVE